MQNDDKKLNNRNNSSISGGFFIAILGLAGFFIGAYNGEAPLGTILGITMGAMIAICVWLYDMKIQQK